MAGNYDFRDRSLRELTQHKYELAKERNIPKLRNRGLVLVVQCWGRFWGDSIRWATGSSAEFLAPAGISATLNTCQTLFSLGAQHLR